MHYEYRESWQIYFLGIELIRQSFGKFRSQNIPDSQKKLCRVSVLFSSVEDKKIEAQTWHYGAFR